MAFGCPVLLSNDQRSEAEAASATGRRHSRTLAQDDKGGRMGNEKSGMRECRVSEVGGTGRNRVNIGALCQIIVERGLQKPLLCSCVSPGMGAEAGIRAD